MPTNNTNASRERKNEAARKRYAAKASRNQGIHVTPGVLAARAMLVSLSFSIWDAWAYDQPEGDKVAKRNHVDEGTVKVRKELFPFDAPSYDLIPKTYRKIKRFHELNTLEWARGVNILNASFFDEYNTTIHTLTGEFNSAVRAFFKDYENLKKRAKAELNGLYKEDDWPEVDELKDRFGVSVTYLPVPMAGDFRVDLSGDALKSVQAQIEADTLKRERDAMGTLYGEVRDAVLKVVNVIKEDKVKQPVFDALAKLCQERVPRLNISGDPNLTKFAEEIQASLGSIQAKEVREDDKLRKEVETKAKELANKMKQFMA